MKIEFTGELQRVDVRPGDVFVLTTEHALICETVDRIKQEWNREFERRGREPPMLLVLGDGMKLGVYRQQNVKDLFEVINAGIRDGHKINLASLP